MLETLRRAVCRKLRMDLSQIRRCALLLSRDELWRRANAHCNSVGNLILHLTGNVSQWAVAGLKRHATPRDRPGEFSQRDAGDAATILAPLESAVESAIRIIESLSAPELGERFSIQGYDVSGVEVVFHVGEHFSFHTGQIVHITKALRDVDLSLFDPQGRLLAATGGQPWA